MTYVNNYIPPAQATTDIVKDCRDELFRYCTRFFYTLSEFLVFHCEPCFRRNPHQLPFAIIDKSRQDPAHAGWGGSFAGVVSLINTSAQNTQMEPGWVLVFPEFRSTHVAKEWSRSCCRTSSTCRPRRPGGLGFAARTGGRTR
ncbi:hypothetical protein TRAPUB_5491 [Trametes pubescens]|uniref:N-acetyltransferase domain-containing protein n=1 Tax=Trametes pubescens TaxID=154538 RepID=A0A1M2W755_TRAPU|nr:hypothetical protein TRAPUB_5491 [Trametes pubescens]